MNLSKRTVSASPLLTVSAVIFFIYAGQSMLWPLIPLYAGAKGASPAIVGVIVLANLAASAILSIPFGHVSDRIGRVRIITLGSLVAAGSIAATGFSVEPIAIMITYAAAGIGHAAYGPGTTSYPADIAEPGHMNRSIGITQTARQLSFSLGPALGGILAEVLGYAASFFVAAALVVAGGILAGLLLPERVRGKALTQASWRKTFLGVMRDLGMVGSMVSIFTLMFAYFSFTSFMPVFSKNVSIPLSLIGLLLAVQSAGNIVSRLVIGPISDKTGKRTPFLILGLCIAAVTLALSASFTSPEAIAILSFSLGFSAGFSTVIINTVMAERASYETRGLTLGFFNTALYAGSGIGPAVTGLIVGLSGFDSAFKVAALVAAAGAITQLSVARRKDIP